MKKWKKRWFSCDKHEKNDSSDDETGIIFNAICLIFYSLDGAITDKMKEKENDIIQVWPIRWND
jgi:hypothetical protein